MAQTDIRLSCSYDYAREEAKPVPDAQLLALG
jgi:hypothetical protein